MKFAWTLDDAPSLPSIADAPPDPDRMDRTRQRLQARGLRHCVAFVNSDRVGRRKVVLERWLEAGFELGNHTCDHVTSSARSPDEVLRAVERCDRLLAEVGAFDGGRTKWFRFPYLDRGANPIARSRIAQGLFDLGLRHAPGSVDSFDYRYEAPLARSLASDDVEGVAQVRRRFLRAVRLGLSLARLRSQNHLGRTMQHVGYGHFGLVNDHFMLDALDLYEEAGAEWTSLEAASSDPAFAEYEADFERNGIVLGDHPPLSERLLKRLSRLLGSSRVLGRREAGPLIPLC